MGFELEGVAGRNLKNEVLGGRRWRKERNGVEELGSEFWGIKARVLDGIGEERR